VALKKIAVRNSSDLQIRWRALVLAARLLKHEVRPEITQAARSSDWFMRSAAMIAANEISTDEAAVLARKLVNDKALVVRSAAVDILGGTGLPTDRQILWRIIHDPVNSRNGQSLWIRSQALELLAKHPQKKEVADFMNLLKESDLELQAIAIHGLEQISETKFGGAQESIEQHRRKWLQWWELEGKVKSI
jgi:HEAT repeat protein